MNEDNIQQYIILAAIAFFILIVLVLSNEYFTNKNQLINACNKINLTYIELRYNKVDCSGQIFCYRNTCLSRDKWEECITKGKELYTENCYTTIVTE